MFKSKCVQQWNVVYFFICKCEYMAFLNVSIALTLRVEVPENHSLPSDTFMNMTFLICISPHRKNFTAFTSTRLEINIPGFTWFFSPSVCLFPVSILLVHQDYWTSEISLFSVVSTPAVSVCPWDCCSSSPTLPGPSLHSMLASVSELDLRVIFCISFATSWVSLALQLSVPKGVEVGLPTSGARACAPCLGTPCVALRFPVLAWLPSSSGSRDCSAS